ncbi:MAG: ABC transporter substrate-binding protein [Actinomycetota bacterium]|nr:MAG: ABC transporter substrate-binding protein [Actinomycetota bacterium]
MRPARLAMIGAAAAVLVPAIAACGSDAGPSASGSAAPLTLKVAVSIPDPSQSQVFIAQQAGYFREFGLDVQISLPGPNTVTSVSSGQVDVAFGGAGAPASVQNQGKATSIVYWGLGNKAAGFVIGKTGITKIEDCKTIITVPQATSPYGWAVAYQKALDLKYQIVPQGDASAISNSVAAGTNDCGITTFGTIYPAVAAGKATVIVDPRNVSSLPAKLQPLNFADTAVWGLRDNLKNKQAELVAFIKGMDKGLKKMKSDTPDQLATLLLQDSVWKGYTKDQLAMLIKEQMFGFAPEDGFISEAAWAQDVVFLNQSAYPYVQANDPNWSYAARVDMGPYKQALGK